MLDKIWIKFNALFVHLSKSIGSKFCQFAFYDPQLSSKKRKNYDIFADGQKISIRNKIKRYKNFIYLKNLNNINKILNLLSC